MFGLLYIGRIEERIDIQIIEILNNKVLHDFLLYTTEKKLKRSFYIAVQAVEMLKLSLPALRHIETPTYIVLN